MIAPPHPAPPASPMAAPRPRRPAPFHRQPALLNLGAGRNMNSQFAVTGHRVRLVSLPAGQVESLQRSTAIFLPVNILNLSMLLLEFHANKNPPARNSELHTSLPITP